MKQKIFFIIFKGVSVAKSCLRPQGAPLNRPLQKQTCSIQKGVAEACNFIKKQTLAQAFSYEFCEIFKNTYFFITPPLVVSNSAKQNEIFACIYGKKLKFFYKDFSNKWK